MRRFLDLAGPCGITFLIGALVWFVMPLPKTSVFPTLPDAVGGPQFVAEAREFSPARARDVAMRDRESERILLERKEEILRAHLQELTEEEDGVTREEVAVRRALILAKSGGDHARGSALERRLAELQETSGDIREARGLLEELRLDRARYEEMLLAELREDREALAHAAKRKIAAAPPVSPDIPEDDIPAAAYDFAWPVVPRKGISAGYLDAGYRKRFRREHEAIDIPVAQGSDVRAPADGVVLAVHDRGLGYSTLSLRHGGDIVTVYGHVSAILVAEGQRVARGDIIALSGGRPGSKGAGLLTTGPHLHFEVLAYGQHIDPLYELPPLPSLMFAQGDAAEEGSL